MKATKKKTTTKVKHNADKIDPLPEAEFTDEPCPFCASPGQYDYGKFDGEVLWFINCTKCRGGVGPYGRKSDCTKAWERRPKK